MTWEKGREGVFLNAKEEKKAWDLRTVSIGVLWIGLGLLYILLTQENVSGSNMALMRPIGMATALYAAFVLIRFRLFPMKVYPELWLFGLYIVAACVPGFFLAADRAAHMHMARRLAQGFAMVVSVYAFLGLTRSSRPILWLLLGASLIFAALGLAGRITYYRVFRQTLGGLNANIYARTPMFGFLACLGLMNACRGWKRIAFVPALAACAYMLLVSGSRATILSWASGTAVYIALTAPREDLRGFYRKVLLPAAAGAAVLCVVVLLIRNPYQLKSFWTRATMFFSDGNHSTSSRLAAITEALRQFARHPVFGIGAYQFRTLTAGTLDLNHAHCDLAELLMAYGLVGTALYVACAFYGARGIVRTLRLQGLKNPPAGSMAATMAGLFVAYLVMGLGDITIYEMNCQFVWAALTACGMLNRLNGTAV